MRRLDGESLFRATAVGLLLCAVAVSPAAVPPPANDAPANAEVIGPATPIVVYGTTVQALNDVNATPGLPSLDAYVDGPDVFYSFTPTSSETYRIMLLPWQLAPLRSSDRKFTVYVYDNPAAFLAGARTTTSAYPVYFDVALTAGVAYTIGVDHDAMTYDNFPFTLLVDRMHVTNPDNCGTAEALSGPLPLVKLNNIDNAVHDYSFVQGDGRCGVAATTTAPGNDHVYTFTPAVTGDYAIELVGLSFDAVLYVNDSCPPVFPDGCLGASNHGSGASSGAKHELVVVTLTAGQTYYIYVDNHSTTALTGPYALIIDDAFVYEINEVEPNDRSTLATPVTTPLNGGQLVGPTDEDWWAITGQTGDRVYAWVNNGGSSNSTLDTDLAFYAADGQTLIEFDDEDADGADAPLNDLRYVYSTSAPVIAGARLTSDGTHYFLVTDQSATGTVSRYMFHVGLEPATRTPLAECDPNDTLAAADFSGKHYYTGVIDTSDDVDFFAFEATIGDRVFIAFDGDPERDANGVDPANTDPNAFHGKLVVYDPDGDILISDISDANSVQSPPDYPAQGGFFIARHAGTHYVAVMPQGSSSQVGPTETYELAIFLNDAAPALSEEIDPLMTITPDSQTQSLLVEATDNQPGDSGICNVWLAMNTNLQITNLSFTPGDPTVTFNLTAVTPGQAGLAKLFVQDCAGNTVCKLAVLDIDPPVCEGTNFATRDLPSLHDPLHVTDNDPTGVAGTINVPEAGTISDVNVTMTIDALDTGDLDIYLISPTGTTVELVTDRMSSLGRDMVDVTFDDDAAELIPILSSAAPYTGSWLPEDALGLAKLNGEDAQGTWRLLVIDDASSEDFGATIVHWSLEIRAGFPGPESFAGRASDLVGFSAGLESVELTSAVNTQLNLPPEFVPGDLEVSYTVTLVDPSQPGSATVVVTDMYGLTCDSVVSLSPLTDNTAPANDGAVTTDLTFKAEVEQEVPASYLPGITSTIDVPLSFPVGEVEVALFVDTDNQGRIAAFLTHGGEFAALVNRIGMDERQSVGNTKNSFDVLLDDDAPMEDDIHAEPALGTIATLGLHQPDGRGEYFGDGITSDPRDDMLFNLAGLDAAGAWELRVADCRAFGSSENILRRWALTLKHPCGPERYVGRAVDVVAGIASLELAAGASNLVLVADYLPGDLFVDYRVELVDPAQPGTGTLEITDSVGNVTQVPIQLAAAGLDTTPPAVTGGLVPGYIYEGTATDNGANDRGIYDVALGPWAENLQLLSVNPDPPNGAGTVTFAVRRIDPLANGRGYLRVEDGCGWRSYLLIEIDALAPECSGSVGTTKRYVSTDGPLPIPDNSPAGIVSTITVPDADIISDVNVTLNILHGYDDDLDLALLAPATFMLFDDIGSTGNDFIDTVLDDEAAAPIPDSSSEAPFTGVYQCENGPNVLAGLDGLSAAGLWRLSVVDDKTNDTGTFLNWAVTIESATFPQRYDGRAADGQRHDLGICSIAVVPGSLNLAVMADVFTPGDPIVRYSAELVYPYAPGGGAVRVTDCGGNYTDVPVTLAAFGTCLGDSNCDGAVTWRDIDFFVAAMNDNIAAWEALFAPEVPLCLFGNNDVNGDGTVSWRDIDPFVALMNQPCPQ